MSAEKKYVFVTFLWEISFQLMKYVIISVILIFLNPSAHTSAHYPTQHPNPSLLLKLNWPLRASLVHPQYTHEAFMIEIRCLEGTFGCKSYDLSDWYRLYIGCKKAGSTITNQNKGLLDRIRLIPRQWGRQ